MEQGNILAPEWGGRLDEARVAARTMSALAGAGAPTTEGQGYCAGGGGGVW